MSGADACAQARQAFARRSWSAAYAAFAAADAQAPLAADDRERLALAAFLTGHEAEADLARERAHHDHLANGNVEGAARAAFWLGLALTLRGEHARGGGWFARAQRVLDDAAADESVWHGYLLVPQAMRLLFARRPAEALPLFDRAVSIATRHQDADLMVLARHGHGQCRVAMGSVRDGLAELDEVLVTVTTDVVSPQVVGLVYCAVIETCRDCYDLRRSREWTDALSRWCALQPDLVPYRGQCLVHRAEILQVHGSWPDAMAEVEQACARLGGPAADVASGMALYQQGELQRLRGEYAAAEGSYRAAVQCGHDPQPGLALLRLAQGNVDAAFAAINRALDERFRPMHRPRLLPALVEIALGAGDVPTARAAADELRDDAKRIGAPLLEAAALHANGAVLLAADSPRDAVGVLRRAWACWQDLGAPYDAARSRVLIARACRAVGDDDGAEMELDAARWVFEQLGARPDLDRVRALSRRARRPTIAGGLTLREVQVLRLVATGATNRTIAGELFLSEKTVARHVANIFAKLGISSRAAATAYAYDHQLL